MYRSLRVIILGSLLPVASNPLKGLGTMGHKAKLRGRVCTSYARKPRIKLINKVHSFQETRFRILASKAFDLVHSISRSI